VRASLRVAGIEVELTAPRGPLETILVERYGHFLGVVERPVCRVAVGARVASRNAPQRGVQGGLGRYVTIWSPGYFAELDLAGRGAVEINADRDEVEQFVRTLVSLLALRKDALLLEAFGVIIRGRAHVIVGAGPAEMGALAELSGARPLLSDRCVIVRRIRGLWLAASTPFWASPDASRPDRQAPLSMLWRRGSIDTADSVLRHVVVPAPDGDIVERATAIASELERDVASHELRFTSAREVWETVEGKVCIV
jgi:hypothetical protein